MSKVLSAAQLEETANHLQIQALLAAVTLQDPLSGYQQELEDDDDDDDDDDDHDHHRRRDKGVRRSSERLAKWAKTYAEESGVQVVVTDRSGYSLLKGQKPLTKDELKEARRGISYHRWTSDTIYASAPILRGDDLLGVIRLASPRAQVTARSRTLSLQLALASLLALGCAIVAAVWLSRRLVKPLRRLESNALRASRGEWDQAVVVEGHDELASLALAFSAMLSELRSVFEQQRRFVSNASHELRTPLTRIKLRTEALVDGGLADPSIAEKYVREVDSEVDRLAHLANSLLDLTRLEESPETAETSDAVSVLRAAAAATEPGEVKFLTEIPDSLPPVRLSPESLELLVVNLLDNALKHTPKEGEIRLSALRRDSGLTIIVEDNGQGIAAEHLPYIFQRFYQSNPARSRGGSGLGLALVKAAAESAGGQVSVTSELGRGSRFTVELPAC